MHDAALVIVPWAGSLSRRLGLLADVQRYIGGYQFCAASTCAASTTKLLVLRSRIAPCICRDALHAAVFMGRWVSHDVMLADHDISRLMTTAAWHMPASMRGKQLPRPLLHCTRAMTRVRLSLTSNWLLHMHRITWELLLGMVCTPGMAGTASRARAMTRRYHTVFTPRLH